MRVRRRVLVVALIVIAVLIYVGTLLLYASGSRSTTLDLGQSSERGPAEALITLSPLAVLGPTQRISVDVKIEPPQTVLADDGIETTREMGVLVTPVDGAQTFALDEGALLQATKTMTVVAIDGAIENWPFDRYTVVMAVVPYVVGDDGVKKVIPAQVVWDGSVSGWNFEATEIPDAEVGVVDPGEFAGDHAGEPLPAIYLQATRSSSTVVFGVVLLSLMIVMPALVLFVAIRAFTGRRKVEATLTSWMGAMLFAIIPLRTFLPGSPPIGAWIDYLIVLWVLAALVTGLAVYVLAWNRWGKPADQVVAAEAAAERSEPTPRDGAAS